MGHVSSTPVHGEVTTVSKKQFIRLLSPDALSAQRRKLLKPPSGHHFEGVTVRTTTTRDLGKEQSGAGPSSGAHEPTVSSTPMDACADVLSDQATSMHEMVLKDASTNELLRLLGEFLCRRCRLLKDLSPEDPLMWLRMVDIFLLLSKCQRQCFIVPGSVVFLYMLCRDTVSAEVSSMRELQAVVLTCFYVAFAYIGHELGYPVMPFIVEDDSTVFWKRTLDITKRMSGKMLQINEDPPFFADVFTALKNGTDH
ncbi:cyclin-dependent kinase 5 activator 1-like [Colossoma macropomum]|uniref:cyclin-dependent kinase 5 activator 1-like n=1 Tax=Colossoma macropomum TaxID=42526 RepID=UPI0018654B24|nr:cyclin-dependent kinase 5 activator 1-like [Colossoma macropomum]